MAMMCGRLRPFCFEDEVSFPLPLPLFDIVEDAAWPFFALVGRVFRRPRRMAANEVDSSVRPVVTSGAGEPERGFRFPFEVVQLGSEGFVLREFERFEFRGFGWRVVCLGRD